MTTFAPVPNLTAMRRLRHNTPLRFDFDKNNPLFNDELVDPRDSEWGFYDSASYYSRPNKMTGTVLPGVPDAPLVRRDIARRLKLADDFLRASKDVRRALGVNARIRIDDALRTYEAQKFAYEVAWPQVIRQQQPDISNEELSKLLGMYVAKPADEPSATPHATGGAVDVALINLDSSEMFDRGHEPGSGSGTAFPDFYEGYHLVSGESDISSRAPLPVAPDSIIVQARRVLYYAMTEVAGLIVNPTEIWHYGLGDPLSAMLGGTRPYYDMATPPRYQKTNKAKNRQASAEQLSSQAATDDK